MERSLVIVDLEATCCNQGTVPRHEMEIIEIGAVEVEPRTGEIRSEYQSFVRPVRHPTLTSFCLDLTSISQEDVETAMTFPDVMSDFRSWLTEISLYDFCSWGMYDRIQFEQDCRYHKVGYPFIGIHRNLKVEFSEAIGVPKKFGVGGALQKLGMSFDGTPHRGIDDARNIAKIYAQVIAPKLSR